MWRTANLPDQPHFDSTKTTVEAAAMDRLNELLLSWINAADSPPRATLFVALFSADWLFYFVLLEFVVAWIRGRAEVRLVVLSAVATSVLALSINFVIAALWYHPRPFELGVGHQF
jgi:undecaprenyl-diphosphatase